MTERKDNKSNDKERKSLRDKTDEEDTNSIDGQSNHISCFDTSFVKKVIDRDIDEWEDEERYDGGQIDDFSGFIEYNR